MQIRFFKKHLKSYKCVQALFYLKKNLWPVIIGTNRDEKLDRESLFPNRHWKKKYPNIVGGKDLEKNGINIVIYANQLIRSAIPSMQKTAENILKNQRSFDEVRNMMSIKEILQLLDQ